MTSERWKHSIKNLSNALDRLGEILGEPLDKHDYILDATMQRFEFVIELYWKTLRHLLALQGVSVNLPKEALQKAYAAGWIEEEELWLRMMRDRNLTSHTYKHDSAIAIYKRLSVYYPILRSTFKKLSNQFPV